MAITEQSDQRHKLKFMDLITKCSQNSEPSDNDQSESCTILFSPVWRRKLVSPERMRCLFSFPQLGPLTLLAACLHIKLRTGLLETMFTETALLQRGERRSDAQLFCDLQSLTVACHTHSEEADVLQAFVEEKYLDQPAKHEPIVCHGMLADVLLCYVVQSAKLCHLLGGLCAVFGYTTMLGVDKVGKVLKTAKRNKKTGTANIKTACGEQTERFASGRRHCKCNTASDEDKRNLLNKPAWRSNNADDKRVFDLPAQYELDSSLDYVVNFRTLPFNRSLNDVFSKLFEYSGCWLKVCVLFISCALSRPEARDFCEIPDIVRLALFSNPNICYCQQPPECKQLRVASKAGARCDQCLPNLEIMPLVVSSDPNELQRVCRSPDELLRCLELLLSTVDEILTESREWADRHLPTDHIELVIEATDYWYSEAQRHCTNHSTSTSSTCSQTSEENCATVQMQV